MVIACHITFGAYGFWLPNDPRGSWSEEVWARHLRPFGSATTVQTQRSLAHKDHDRTKRFQAKQQLKYPAVKFTGVQARAVGRGFARIVEQLDLRVHACAIMPDHVHLVTARHNRDAEYLAGLLKRAATRQLTAESLHPLAGYRKGHGRLPSPWVAKCWCKYLNSVDQVCRAIRYVEENPVRSGLPRQRWPFVVPFVS